MRSGGLDAPVGIQELRPHDAYVVVFVSGVLQRF